MSIHTVRLYTLSCDVCGTVLQDGEDNTVHAATRTQILLQAIKPHQLGAWTPAATVNGYATEQRRCRYCAHTQTRPVTLPLSGICGPQETS